MTFLAIPGQLLFLLVIAFLNAGHTTITPQFVLVYVIVSLVQVRISRSTALASVAGRNGAYD